MALISYLPSKAPALRYCIRPYLVLPDHSISTTPEKLFQLVYKLTPDEKTSFRDNGTQTTSEEMKDRKNTRRRTETVSDVFGSPEVCADQAEGPSTRMTGINRSANEKCEMECSVSHIRTSVSALILPPYPGFGRGCVKNKIRIPTSCLSRPEKVKDG